MTTKALILLLLSQSLHASNIAFVPDDKKIALSEEIFNKLSKEHYVQELSNDFNHKYIEHLIDELDGNKRYFTKNACFGFVVNLNFNFSIHFKIWSINHGNTNY